jgi:predicted nuclease of restriction endonuclease-like (RecB) superfamily
MNHFNLTPDYTTWLKELKAKIRSAQIKAVLSANTVLIDFYLDLGRMISEKDAVWGSKFLEKLSADLKSEFSEMQGFSVTNLKYCRLFYEYLAIRPQAGDGLEMVNGPQAGDEMSNVTKTALYQTIRQMPWGHIKLLLGKVKEQQEALFYIQQTIENGWSRDKNKIETEFSLRDINKPMGVSEFTLTEVLPDELKGAMPSVEEIEAEIGGEWKVEDEQ